MKIYPVLEAEMKKRGIHQDALAVLLSRSKSAISMKLHGSTRPFTAEERRIIHEKYFQDMNDNLLFLYSPSYPYRYPYRKRGIGIMVLKPKSSAEWLKMRREIGIGGSDAGAVVGLSHWKTNVDLWREKTGIAKANDISDVSAVKFGKEAEKHIRGLFVLEHPEYDVDYHEFWMYLNCENDFMYATLDGELTDKETGSKGILEIKTTTIHNNNQWNDWENRIPDSYYVQILHQLACTGWDFVVLKAYIMYTAKDGGNNVTIREYRIDRKDVVSEIDFLIKKEAEFMKYVRNKQEPPLILPRI